MLKTPSKTKPFLIFGTRHGSIYNLTPANFPAKSIQAIQLSFGDFFDSKETIKSLPQGMSFKKYLGFPETIKTYLTPYDFYKQEPITGCQNSKQVKIKCTNGYNIIDAEQYDSIASLIKPDILVTLTEYPSLSKDHKKQSNKSYKRAINKTTTYLQQSKMKKAGFEENQNEGYQLRLGAVHGAKNTALLSRSIQQILQHQVDGFVVCDLCQEETIQQRQSIFNHIFERLKQQQNSGQYIMALAGQGKIQDIEHAREFGYTHFEVNYPFSLAQKHLALIRLENGSYQQRVPVKHENLEPLDKHCKCETCQRHSQSYIAHLIECHQMTASVLLTIHNVHMYVDYLNKFDE